MTSEPRVKICLSLQAETLRRLDARARFFDPERPNRSATADMALTLVAQNFSFHPVTDETPDAS